MKFSVPDMSCGHCTAAISKSITASDPAAQVVTDLTARTVSIETEAQQADILAAISAAGYAAEPL
ncbi:MULTISPECIES: heavy-metal-associated domain-containing protein [unclassified Marinovum]